MVEKEEPKAFEVYSEKYAELSKKYNLPKLDLLRVDFEVGKTFDKETPFFVKEIRRVIAEKISAYVHLLESLINPSNSAPYVFVFLKNLSEENKKEIKDGYKELVKLHLETLKLDTIYDEKKESEYIIKAFAKWQELKVKIYRLIEIFEEEYKKNSEFKEKSYFG